MATFQRSDDDKQSPFECREYVIDDYDADVHRARVLSVGLKDAITRDRLSPWSWKMLRLYGIVLLTTLNCCMNGYDGMLMSSVNAMDSFHKHFGTEMQGSQTGILFSIYAIGTLAGAAVSAPASDTFGRRFGMSVGSMLIIVGAGLEAAANELSQFIGGRFLIGMGVNLANTAAVIYLVEIALPHWRGTFGGLYNVVGYYTGSLSCTWIAYGTGFLASNWSWQIPVIIQAVPPFIVMTCAWLMPESPRWLFANNKAEQAREMLVKYHGMGDPDSSIVAYECNEIEADVRLEADLGGRRWWDYKVLFSSREMLYRMWLLFLVCIFSQFIGGSVIAYYLPVMLENAGIKSQSQQLLLNAMNNVFGFVSGICGSFTVDLWGRRTLFLYGTFITGLIYIPINVIASFDADNITTSMGYGFIACIFLYGIVYAFCWTPLQTLYPAEILPNHARAKGMAFQSIVYGASSFINLYATPTGLSTIGWKMYTIFMVFHFLEYVFMFFTLPETKGRTIEELEVLFAARNPVKASLQRYEVIFREGGGVKMLD
ncbi:putative transporter [Aspergillus candidus]|uniref:Putative transporter n=1 Tax=Aspergillus candidus TaxID=41067 RepID=A0A2I2F2P9_ASPCN|nr:putative transporter [Aspergillus candidus]PLB34889.1 putative transporter [Aspergillus candidus]